MATIAELLPKAFSVLAVSAIKHEVLTYEALADKIGTIARVSAQVLPKLRSFCLSMNLPDLTTLVINKELGIPSDGFFEGKNLASLKAKVDY